MGVEGFFGFRVWSDRRVEPGPLRFKATLRHGGGEGGGGVGGVGGGGGTPVFQRGYAFEANKRGGG